MNTISRLVFSLLAMVSSAVAYTVVGSTYTTDGSQADVQAAINAASSGATVVLPSGTFTWSTGITCSKSVTISGSGYTPNTTSGGTYPGAPGLSTTVNFTTSSGTAIAVTSATTGTNIFRLSGIDFTGLVNTNGDLYLSFSGSVSTDAFRVDDCTFDGGSIQAVMLGISGNPVGCVIDHCSFGGGPASEMIHNFGMGSGNTAGWKDNVTPGSNQLVYVEDCVFQMYNWNSQTYQTGTSALQGYYGSRTCVRYSTLFMSQIDQHGTPGMVGARWFEFYDLMFVEGAASVSNASGMNCFALRGGSGFVFNISLTPSNMYRAGSVVYSDDSSPCPFGPGNGIFLSGSAQVPDDASPVYLWGLSSYLGVGTQAGLSGPNDIAVNRNFYVSSSQPTNITIYQAATGAVTNYSYTPYAYPHPLVTGAAPYAAWETSLFSELVTIGINASNRASIQSWVTANAPTVPYSTWESALDAYMTSITVSAHHVNQVNAWMGVNPPTP